MNMFKPSKAKSVQEYFELLPEERREAMNFLHQFIQKTVPSLKPVFVSNMPGYGTFTYKNHKKDTLEWPVIALASQKNYISLYICAIHKGKYLPESHKAELGKVSVGKSCIRFKKLEDLNLKTLQKILLLAEKHPGLH